GGAAGHCAGCSRPADRTADPPAPAGLRGRAGAVSIIALSGGGRGRRSPRSAVAGAPEVAGPPGARSWGGAVPSVGAVGAVGAVAPGGPGGRPVCDRAPRDPGGGVILGLRPRRGRGPARRGRRAPTGGGWRRSGTAPRRGPV